MQCPHCYFPNPDGSGFCTNCGKAITGAPPRAGPVPVSLPTSERIGLLVVPPDLTLPAGGQVAATLTVTNQGTTVDEFALHIEGLPREWWTITPPALSLFPQDRAQAQVTITAPRAVETAAATYPFHVLAVSRQNERESTAAAGRVELLPFGEFSVSIAPDKARGRSATYTLTLSNRRSEPRQVQLVARDPEEALRYDGLPAAPLALAPGASVTAPFRVRPKDDTITGPERVYRFRVTASPPGVVWEESEARVVEAELAYTPRMEKWPWESWPRWAKRLAMLALPIAALLVALLLAGRSNKLPFQSSAATATPTTPPVATAPVLPGPGGATPGARPSQPAGQTPPAQTPPAQTPPAGGGANPGGGGAAVPVPSIQRFELVSDPRDAMKVQLVWDVQGQTDEVTVNGKGVKPKDAMAVDTAKDQTFTLVAKNKGGSATASVGVVVLRPPAKPEFRANPNPVRAGDAVTLSWKADGATDITINGGPVQAPEGTQRVENLQSPTTFLLVAKNAYGQSVAEVTVTVNPR